MQLVLSEADLDRMPPQLRQGLLQHLFGTAERAGGEASRATPLARAQATSLWREASFHRDGKALHALLKRFVYAEESDAPQRKRLAASLPSAARRQLARHLATLNRLAAHAARKRGAKLWLYRRAADRYDIHPATRQALRELIPVLERSGDGEEPLWEG